MSQVLCCKINTYAGESCEKAVDLCKELGAPSSVEISELSRLFSESSSGRKHPASVALVSESPALAQLKKKKSVIRPVSRGVVVFPAFSGRIPPKPQKQSLVSEGRVKTLIFKRTMSAVQVRNVIIRGFPEIQKIYPFKLLKACKNNKLEISEPEPTGEDVCSQRGTVYIYQSVSI